ncbi:MAG: hypothetical protein HOO06_13020 [Bdellovibrionaceae bacterium]|jgi:hypothetical protein|nr:hypothetical protein [Pseudobdellovibrionaceae bacterium]
MKIIVNTIVLSLFVTLLAACNAEQIGPDVGVKENPKPIQLTRKTQRVIRFNCDGKIESDQVETVSSPKRRVEIVPRDTAKTVVGSSFGNRTNNASAGAVYGHTEFTVDMANAFFTMRVNEGINEIDYQFIFSDGETEIGSRFLDITYAEEFIPEVYENIPSEESCEEVVEE